MTPDRKKLHEIFNLLKSKGIVHTQKEFAAQIGFDKGNISSAFNGNTRYLTEGLFEKIYKKYPDLVDENGDIIKSDTTNPDLDENAPYRLVKHISYDVVGGMKGDSDTTISDPEYVIGLIPFNNALETDICVTVTGDSMTPTCPAGSIVLLREVKEWRGFFGHGNIFCILLKDGRRLLKEINESDVSSKDNVLCISHNNTVKPEELPKNMIDRVWKVIKILIDKGW